VDSEFVNNIIDPRCAVRCNIWHNWKNTL